MSIAAANLQHDRFQQRLDEFPAWFLELRKCSQIRMLAVGCHTCGCELWYLQGKSIRSMGRFVISNNWRRHRSGSIKSTIPCNLQNRVQGLSWWTNIDLSGFWAQRGLSRLFHGWWYSEESHLGINYGKYDSNCTSRPKLHNGRKCHHANCRWIQNWALQSAKLRGIILEPRRIETLAKEHCLWRQETHFHNLGSS